MDDGALGGDAARGEYPQTFTSRTRRSLQDRRNKPRTPIPIIKDESEWGR